MEPQIIERVSTLETDVAVIQSTYVRRDELAALREEMGVGFAKVNANIHAVHTELDSKINQLRIEVNGKFEQLRTEVNGKFEQLRTEVNGKFDQLRDELDVKLERAITTMLKRTFGLQISIVALAIAAIKYL